MSRRSEGIFYFHVVDRRNGSAARRALALLGLEGQQFFSANIPSDHTRHVWEE